MSSLISFVIPTYNSERFVSRAILSLMKQRCKDFEIIIVDDSTDTTIAVVENILKSYSFDDYRVFHNTERRGQSYAKNKGLLEARGKYVIFLDSDDYVDEHLVESLSNAISRFEPEMICWRFECRNENDQAVEGWRLNGLSAGIYQGCEVLSKILIDRNFWISTISAAYAREEIHKKRFGFSEDVYNGEDLEFTWKFLASAGRVLYLDETLSYYVLRETSLSRTPSLCKFTNMFAFDRIIEFVHNNVNCSRKDEILKGLEEEKLHHFIITLDQLLYNQKEGFGILNKIEAQYPGLLKKLKSNAKKFRFYSFISKRPSDSKLLILGLSWSPTIYTILRKIRLSFRVMSE